MSQNKQFDVIQIPIGRKIWKNKT